METWTEDGLIAHLVDLHDRMQDRTFAFILGSGASRPSEIPTGGELVTRWLEELHFRRSDRKLPLAQWATAETLGIEGFDYAQAASFYPQVFVARFGRDPDEGYAFLESIMEGREPSFGYSVLAQILTNTRHRVVITTNFDNLVSDAVSWFTGRQAFVCGHELMTGFVKARLRRPLVAKIHRDLLLHPLNHPETTGVLLPGWTDALRTLFANYTPVVIGYGGNDGSLMNLLKQLKSGEIVGGIYWCYRRGSSEPGQMILDVIRQHRGILIPITGFDELFLRLGERLRLPLLDEELAQRADRRIQGYRAAAARLGERVGGAGRQDLLDAVRAVAEHTQSAAGRLMLAKSLSKAAPDQTEAIYKNQLALTPDDPIVLEAYGLFLAEGGHLEKARDTLSRVLLISPERESVRATIAALENALPEAVVGINTFLSK